MDCVRWLSVRPVNNSAASPLDPTSRDPNLSAFSSTSVGPLESHQKGWKSALAVYRSTPARGRKQLKLESEPWQGFQVASFGMHRGFLRGHVKELAEVSSWLPYTSFLIPLSATLSLFYSPVLHLPLSHPGHVAYRGSARGLGLAGRKMH